MSFVSYGGKIRRCVSLRRERRNRFLKILEATYLANSDGTRDTVLSDMKRDFSKDPEYWDWLARHMSDSISKETGVGFSNPQMQKAIQVYEEGLQSLTSSSMFETYIKFLMEAIARGNGDVDDESSPLSNLVGGFISHLINVYQKADTTSCLTEDLTREYVALYLKLGRTHEAEKLVEMLCNGKFPGSAKLRLSRVSIDIRSLSGNPASYNNADLQSIIVLISNALGKVPTSESESLWLLALKFFVHQRSYFDKLVEMSIISVAKGSGSDHGFSFTSTIINFILQTKGNQSARETCKRFLALPRPSLILYKDCIEIETNLASLGDKDCLTNAWKLYDSAVASYSQDLELWQDYYSLENKMGTSETAIGVYWRARKTLKEAASLIVRSDLL